MKKENKKVKKPVDTSKVSGGAGIYQDKDNGVAKDKNSDNLNNLY